MVSPRNHYHSLLRLLIVLAIAFSLTAWLYYLATLYTVEFATGSEKVGESKLMEFFRDHGAWLLFVELFALAVCTWAVIFRPFDDNQEDDRH